MDENATSVSATLPFLDFSGDPGLLGLQGADYAELLLEPAWPDLREHVLEQIVGDHRLQRLGRLMPGLLAHPGATLPAHMLSARTQHLLSRRGIRGWADLAEESPADLADMRQAGPHTVREILALALEFASGPLRGDGELLEHVTDTVAAKQSCDAAAAGLRALATWAERERSTASISDLLVLSPYLGAPDELVTAWSRLDVKIADLADPDLIKPTLSELFEMLLANLREGRRLVLEQRLLAEHPKTLEDLGKIRGVTREAIRLDEVHLKRELEELLSHEEFAPLAWRAWDLGRSLGALAPVEAQATKQAVDRATRDVRDDHRPLVLQLLLRLAGPYESHNGWLVRQGVPGLPSARDLWDAHPAAIAIDLEECRAWLSSQGVDPSHLATWLASTKPGRVLDGKLVRWSGSVLEKAIALLTLRGEPATPEELTDLIGEGHNPRSVRNRLFEDPRVVRVDKHRVALRAWNMEEYSGIAHEIAQRIREHGGVALLDEVVRDLVETFGVAESSVRTYADAPMFVREGNNVRLRGDNEEYSSASGRISGCAGAYLLPSGGVNYTISVDSEVLRGSGRGCPRALAGVLGVAPGDERTFRTADSELRVTWPKASPTGPALGSTRQLAEALGLRAGDLLRLTFVTADGVVTATGLSAADLATAPSSAGLEQLTGLQMAGEDPRQVLGRAMGIEADAVDRALRDRGDGQIAALLPKQNSDGDLDSALEGLAELLKSLD